MVSFTRKGRCCAADGRAVLIVRTLIALPLVSGRVRRETRRRVSGGGSSVLAGGRRNIYSWRRTDHLRANPCERKRMTQAKHHMGADNRKAPGTSHYLVSLQQIGCFASSAGNKRRCHTSKYLLPYGYYVGPVPSPCTPSSEMMIRLLNDSLFLQGCPRA